MNTDETIFKLRVRDILKERGQTQKDLANIMGKSPQYIANVLNSAQGISVNVLIEMAKALDIEFRDLFAPTRGETKSPETLPNVCPHCGKPLKVKIEA